jgi:hypothetical protein
MALVLALGVTMSLAVLGTSVMAYTTENYGTAARSKDDTNAFALAEAGANNALAVLQSPSSDPTNPNLLPPQTKTYENGSTVTWSGSLNLASGLWTITSTSRVRNPTGVNGTPVSRTVKTTAAVTPPPPQPLANKAWNYIYARATGLTCDMSLSNSVQLNAPLHVAGNLCLQNSSSIIRGPLDVGGYLQLTQTANYVGTSSTPISELHVVKGCKWYTNPTHNPCQQGAGTSGFDNLWASKIDNVLPSLPPPVPNWDGWYTAARPGPAHPCAAVVGTPPVFDNDALRNNSLNASSVVDLTPASSYSCKTIGGELSWDASTRVLTVYGTVFIDGSAKVYNGSVNSYSTYGAIYLSGTFLMKNSKLCASVDPDGTTCVVSGWDPKAKMLVVAANGNGTSGGAAAQVLGGDSIQLVNSQFQGALYGTYAIDVDTTSRVDGPMDGSSVKLGQSVTTSFPDLSFVPAGMPGNQIVGPVLGAPGGWSG